MNHVPSTTSFRSVRLRALAIAGLLLTAPVSSPTAEPALPERLIGYSELRTDLPGGRHANIRTTRAVVIGSDGSGRRLVAESLADGPDAWTQFAGWSPDGSRAIVYRGWEDPENARWEEEHKTFRMLPGEWSLDSCLVDLASGEISNLTAVDRVSHYNSGLFFMPDGKTLGFTALVDGVSRPFVMDRDGRDKRAVSADDAGFTYGYSASPDGKLISYHENYQVYVADADGSNKRHVPTGNPFNFAPTWSPDGQWLLFVSGIHGRSDPHIVRRDGGGLRKLVDLGGYQGWISFLDVPDFHQGSSDLPAWSTDGRSVFYTARVEENVELFEITIGGSTTQLTRSAPGTLHYHPTPSPDGTWLAYGSKRDGVRQLFVMRLDDHVERQLTRLGPGRAAMWPHWQPVPAAASPGRAEVEGLQPVLRGETDTELAPHGQGNVYAPEIHQRGELLLMWYGGQGKDGHDRIHLAESTDGRHWTKRGVALDRGTANHVNDPSVVRVGGRWWMFYTVAATGELDEIAAATSLDGSKWDRHGVVLARGENAAWDSKKVGRPSVLYENGVFRLWFDGQPTPEAAAESPLAESVRREGRAVGYAESRDGLSWERRPEPVFREGAGAIHVTRVAKRLVMMIESGGGVRWATSRDGLNWESRGWLVQTSGGDADRYGQVTPFLLVRERGTKLFFGAAGRRTWDGNTIASIDVTLPGSR